MADILELSRNGTTGPDDNAYVIEKGVPLPPSGGRGRPFIYPFRTMEVGDSFLVPCDDTEKAREVTHRRLTAAWKRVPKRKFTARRIKGTGVRVWRVK